MSMQEEIKKLGKLADQLESKVLSEIVASLEKEVASEKTVTPSRFAETHSRRTSIRNYIEDDIYLPDSWPVLDYGLTIVYAFTPTSKVAEWSDTEWRRKIRNDITRAGRGTDKSFKVSQLDVTLERSHTRVIVGLPHSYDLDDLLYAGLCYDLRRTSKEIENEQPHLIAAGNGRESTEAYKAGALAVLREVWRNPDHVRVGHPEEETVRVMACEMSDLARKFDITTQELWHGLD